jgi:hypothetical protein
MKPGSIPLILNLNSTLCKAQWNFFFGNNFIVGKFRPENGIDNRLCAIVGDCYRGFVIFRYSTGALIVFGEEARVYPLRDLAHQRFIVLYYDLLRRSHSLRKSNLIISRDIWATIRSLLRSLMDERLEIVAHQATQHKPIADSIMKKLLAMISSIESMDPGSEECKSHLLARLKSVMIYFGLL